MRDAEVHAVSVLEQLAGNGDVSPDAVRALVTAATRLYARECERTGAPLPPLAPEVSATEALTLACALLRSQDLTPFDMAVWFSKDGRPNG